MYVSFISRYEPIQRVDTKNLICPVSGTIEPMQLQLYQMEQDRKMMGIKMLTLTTKEISGVFFRTSSGEEIAARQWTSQMESFFEQHKKTAPAKPKKKVFTTFGKIFTGISLGVIILIILAVIILIMLPKHVKNV